MKLDGNIEELKDVPVFDNENQFQIPKSGSSVFNEAEWQERTGWESHLIEKITRPTLEQPELSAMGMALQ